MAKKRKPMTLQPGVRYDGSAIINEYGQIEFTPYNHDVGKRPPQFRTVWTSAEKEIQILRNKEKVRIIITQDRGIVDGTSLSQRLHSDFVKLIFKLNEYDI